MGVSNPSIHLMMPPKKELSPVENFFIKFKFEITIKFNSNDFLRSLFLTVISQFALIDNSTVNAPNLQLDQKMFLFQWQKFSKMSDSSKVCLGVTEHILNTSNVCLKPTLKLLNLLNNYLPLLRNVDSLEFNYLLFAHDLY